MSGSSHAISVSIDTNRLVDQHSFQRALAGVPHGEFSHHSIPGPEGSIMVWHLWVTENWQMDNEDVNDLLMHPRASANLTNHANQQ